MVKRLALVVAIGTATAGYAAIFWPYVMQQERPSDFAQLWVGAQILLRGDNPWALMGPGRTIPAQFPLYYPAPALVAVMPLIWLPMRVAASLFVGLGAGLLAWALTKDRLADPRLLVFPSFAMMATAQNVQWSPYLTAAVLMPSLGAVLACKPTIGAAVWLAYPSRRTFLLAAGFAGITLLFWPWWVQAWLAELPSATHVTAPVFRLGGPILLLALLRWRRTDARLLLALACIPQTPGMNETVPLFLIVRTLPEGLILFTNSIIGGALTQELGRAALVQEWWRINGASMLLTMYLPCLVMVLRRPNIASGQPRLADSLEPAREHLKPRGADPLRLVGARPQDCAIRGVPARVDGAERDPPRNPCVGAG